MRVQNARNQRAHRFVESHPLQKCLLVGWLVGAAQHTAPSQQQCMVRHKLTVCGESTHLSVCPSSTHPCIHCSFVFHQHRNQSITCCRNFASRHTAEWGALNARQLSNTSKTCRTQKQRTQAQPTTTTTTASISPLSEASGVTRTQNMGPCTACTN